MEIKKNTKASLENYSKLFLLLGLLWALLVSYLAVEYKSEHQNNFADLNYNNEVIDDHEIVPITKTIEAPNTAKQEVILNEINKVIDNQNIDETSIKPTDLEPDEPLTNNKLTGISEVKIEDPDVETVPFILIEEAPTFPGCTGNKLQKKECFTTKLSKFISKEFNADLAQNLGLSSGKHRIMVLFTIHKNGEITDIQARAPHVSLEKEAIRIVSLLPKMIPGKQREKAVNVKYSLPISFNVE